MATTLLKEINGVPIALYNDGTNIYVAYPAGKIAKIVISTKVETPFKIMAKEVRAMISDATYLYIGTGDGELIRVTISGGATSTREFFDSAVVSLGLNSTNLYVGLANGQIRLKDIS